MGICPDTDIDPQLIYHLKETGKQLIPEKRTNIFTTSSMFVVL